MNRPKVLVVDDDEFVGRLVKTILNAEGFEVLVEQDGASALAKAAADIPDLVLLDLRLPGLDGLKVLERLKADSPMLPVVMLTGSRDLKDAVQAMRLGAFDYLTKPVHRDEIVVVARRALETHDLQVEVQELRRHVGKPSGNDLVTKMGSSTKVAQIVEQVELVAASNFTVLVLGETGTGKELVAQAIHQSSARARKPFVALDCGAIPESLLESELFGHEKGAFTGAERRREGRFRLAEGGTCFLDEISNLPMNLQAKLLRVLESGQVQPIGAERSSRLDVRFVAATNHDLQERVSQGQFRADLYFRLAQYSIRLPPLRERGEDVAFLTQRFVEEASIELRRPIQVILPEALELLRWHEWPGNVRELRNVVRQAVLQTKGLAIRADDVRPLLGERVEAEPVDDEAATGQSLREIAAQAAREAEREAISTVLRSTAGNKSRAAKMLKTDYKTLHLKMKSLGIRARE